MRAILPLLAAVVLAGCATPAKFRAKMDGFVGQPESALIAMYGVPQNTYSGADGMRYVEYRRGGQVYIPGATTSVPVTTNTAGTVTVNQGLRQPVTGNYTATSTTYVQQRAPGVSFDAWCAVTFMIDQRGWIRHWTAQGNNCVAE